MLKAHYITEKYTVLLKDAVNVLCTCFSCVLQITSDCDLKTGFNENPWFNWHYYTMRVCWITQMYLNETNMLENRGLLSLTHICLLSDAKSSNQYSTTFKLMALSTFCFHFQRTLSDMIIFKHIQILSYMSEIFSIISNFLTISS